MSGSLQVYLFLVLMNVACGFVMSKGYIEEKFPALSSLLNILSSQVGRIVLAVGGILVGLIGLFSFHLNQIIFIADMLPSFSVIIAGLFIALPLAPDKMKSSRFYTVMSGIASRHETVIGMTVIALGVTHIIFPRIVFL